MDQQQSVATGRLTLDEAIVQNFTASLRGEVLVPLTRATTRLARFITG